MASLFPLDQEAGVCEDNLRRACTWFFRAKARLEPNKSWKDVLDSRKTRQEECLGVASVITFACSHISRSDFEMTLIEGYVHGDANIRLGSLKRWLPMNHLELPELLEIKFEAILPGRNQHDQRYTQHPIIRNFLDETVREFGAGCRLAKQSCIHSSSFAFWMFQYEAKDLATMC